MKVGGDSECKNVLKSIQHNTLFSVINTVEIAMYKDFLTWGGGVKWILLMEILCIDVLNIDANLNVDKSNCSTID